MSPRTRGLRHPILELRKRQRDGDTSANKRTNDGTDEDLNGTTVQTSAERVDFRSYFLSIVQDEASRLTVCTMSVRFKSGQCDAERGVLSNRCRWLGAQNLCGDVAAS